MVMEIIVQSLLLVLLIGLTGVGIFIWLNRTDAELDDLSVEESFNPKSQIDKQYQHRGEPDEPDPATALKAYQYRPGERRASRTDLRVTKLPDSSKTTIDNSDTAVDISENAGLAISNKNSSS